MPFNQRSHIYIPTASYYISRSLRSVTPRSATPRTLNNKHILNDPSILMCQHVLLSTRTAIVRRAPTNENTETQKKNLSVTKFCHNSSISYDALGILKT